MKDSLGQDINVGDWVAYRFMHYVQLRTSKVTFLNKKTIRTTLKEGATINIAPSEVIVITSQYNEAREKYPEEFI